MKTRIEICCICNNEEASLAVRYGAHAIGLVGKMPGGPGPTDQWLPVITIVFKPCLAKY